MEGFVKLGQLWSLQTIVGTGFLKVGVKKDVDYRVFRQFGENCRHKEVFYYLEFLQINLSIVHLNLKYVKVKIPCKTYVRRYMEYNYPGEQVITINNILGKLVHLCLEKNSSHLHKSAEVNRSETRYKLMTDYFTVLLPANDNTFYRTGFSIPPQNQVIINNYFEDAITRELNMIANVYQKANMSINQAIEDFCQERNIILDVDITHAALKKAGYRYRNKIKERIKENKRAQKCV